MRYEVKLYYNSTDAVVGASPTHSLNAQPKHIVHHTAQPKHTVHHTAQPFILVAFRGVTGGAVRAVPSECSASYGDGDGMPRLCRDSAVGSGEILVATVARSGDVLCVVRCVRPPTM